MPGLQNKTRPTLQSYFVSVKPTVTVITMGTGSPLRIVGEATEWEPHPPEHLKEMKDALARMEANGDMKIID